MCVLKNLLYNLFFVFFFNATTKNSDFIQFGTKQYLTSLRQALIHSIMTCRRRFFYLAFLLDFTSLNRVPHELKRCSTVKRRISVRINFRRTIFPHFSHIFFFSQVSSIRIVEISFHCHFLLNNYMRYALFVILVLSLRLKKINRIIN